MRNSIEKMFIIGAIGAGTMSLSAHAELVGQWELGQGDSTATIQFDFQDNSTYVISLSWDGELTGRGAFDLIEDEALNVFDFEFDYISYSFGDFLTGVGIEDSYNYGTGTPPDYTDTWGYWTAEGDGDWSSSMIGFSSRILLDGSRDGWVFEGGAPASIPAPATLGLLALLPVGRKRRR